MRKALVVVALLAGSVLYAQDGYFPISIYGLIPPTNANWPQERQSLLALGINEIEGSLRPQNASPSSETLSIRQICDNTNGEIKATIEAIPTMNVHLHEVIKSWANSAVLPSDYKSTIESYLLDVYDFYQDRPIIGNFFVGNEPYYGTDTIKWRVYSRAANYACSFWRESMGFPENLKNRSVIIVPADILINHPFNFYQFAQFFDSIGCFENDFYPYRNGVPSNYEINSSEFQAFQNALNTAVVTYDSCYKYFENPSTKIHSGALWVAITQTYRSTQYNRRWPTKEEIRCQAWLALSRGSKGIKYFCYLTNSSLNGLVTTGRVPRDFTNFPNDPDLADYRIYDWVKELNDSLKEISPTLAYLTGHYAFSVNSADGPPAIPENCYIKTVSTQQPGYSVYNYFDAGCFKDPSDNDYFMLVNRYCQPQDTAVVDVTINYPQQSGQPNKYFITDVLHNQPITGMLSTNQNQTFQVKLLPGGGRLLRIVPFSSAPTLNGGALYTNFRFARLEPNVSTSFSKDSVQITQKYFSSVSDGLWLKTTSGWLPYTNQVIQYLEHSRSNQPNIFEVQYKIDGGKVLTPKYTAQIYFNDVAPATGSITINDGAVYTNDRNVSLRINGVDVYPGLAQMRYAENPFGYQQGYVNHVGNGTFSDTTCWQMYYAGIEDGIARLYRSNNPPVQHGSSMVQTFTQFPNPGQLMRFSADMCGEIWQGAAISIACEFVDSTDTSFQAVWTKQLPYGINLFSDVTALSDTFRMPEGRTIDYMEVSVSLPGFEPWPHPRPRPGPIDIGPRDSIGVILPPVEPYPHPQHPYIYASSIAIDNIRVEPVELHYGVEPKYPGLPAHGYIYDGWDFADTTYPQTVQLSAGDGAKKVYLQHQDYCGNISSEPGWSDSIVLDMVKPSGDIVSPSNGGYVNGTVYVKGLAWDNIESHFQNWALKCKLDGSETWSTMASGTSPLHYLPPKIPPIIYSWNTQSVNDGLYLLRLTAYDKAGNTTADTHYVYVNNGPVLPAVAITADFITFNCLPVDADCDQAGNIYITDTQANKIWEYSPAGDSVLCFGYRSTGHDTVGFNQPVGIAVDDSGFIWVADCYNAKIKKFNPDGSLALSFGDHGSGPGQFNQPTGIAIRGDNVFITDKQNNRVQKFTRNGAYIGHFGQSNLCQPTGIAIKTVIVDTIAIVKYYVSDSKHNRIVVFNENGTVEDSIIGLGLNEPWDIAFDVNDNLYIADVHNDRVVMLDPWGNALLSFGTTGQAAGQFRLPQGLAVSPDGQYLYVIDTHNNRVQRFRMLFETGTGGPNLSGGRKTDPLPMPQYVFELNQNNPNPFKRSTEIRYQLPRRAKVLLKVYNISGQLVKTLVSQDQDAGIYSVKWDGRDQHSNRISSGVYLYRLQAGSLSDTRKIVLLK